MKYKSVYVVAAAVLIWAFGFGACGGGSSSNGGGGNPPAPPPPPPPPVIGWTDLTPSADTVTIFVSDSDGDDADNGLTEATAKRTVAAGKALLRSGFPDWLLLKAGDTWTDQSLGGWTLSGRSASEPMVISSYGSGARPSLLTGTGSAMNTTGTAVSHVYFVGLRFFPHTFTGGQGTVGITWLAVTQNVLLEDCLVEGYKDNVVVQAFDGPPGSIQDFRVRRSMIVDSWSTSGFSQGIYAYGINGLLIEECLFDHNGWKEGPGGTPATIFNQNTYVDTCTNVVMRGNFILRASNLGNKFRSDSTGSSQGLLVEDNVYIEGAVGISCGGNSASADRFVNVTLRRNLLMHIGRTNPVGQDIAWHLTVSDWNVGDIQENLFLYQTQFTNTFAILFEGSSDNNVQVRDNLFYTLRQDSLILSVNGSMTGITVTGNEFQDPSQGSQLIEHSGSFGAVTYQGNVYSTSAAASNWFSVNGGNNSYAQWLTASGETGSSVNALTYPNPGRDEATYMTSLGGTPTLAAFIAEARLQSRANWRPEYTALALNNYVRAGYGR